MGADDGSGRVRRGPASRQRGTRGGKKGGRSGGGEGGDGGSVFSDAASSVGSELSDGSGSTQVSRRLYDARFAAQEAREAENAEKLAAHEAREAKNAEKLAALAAANAEIQATLAALRQGVVVAGDSVGASVGGSSQHEAVDAVGVSAPVGVSAVEAAMDGGVVPEGGTELDAVGAAVGVGVGAVSSVGGGPSNVPITFGGTDEVRPSLAEPASVSGTDAEQSVLAELIAAADGTGIEPSVLAESRATAGGTDDELSPGEHGGGGGQGLRTPGSEVRPHQLEQTEREARDIIAGSVEPALLVGGAGAHVSGSVKSGKSSRSLCGVDGSSQLNGANGRAQVSVANGRAQVSIANGRAQACSADGGTASGSGLVSGANSRERSAVEVYSREQFAVEVNSLERCVGGGSDVAMVKADSGEPGELGIRRVNVAPSSGVNDISSYRCRSVCWCCRWCECWSR